MFTRLALIALLTVTASAQQDQGGGGDMSGARALTPLEDFAGKLKIDIKTQGGDVDRIFAEVAKDAGPIAQEIVQGRQRLVNAELSGKPEDIKIALDAYTAAAQKMAGVEAAAFAKVVAILTPAQQQRSPEAFEQAFAAMAGFFQSAAPRGVGRGGRPGGAPGGDAPTGGAARGGR